MPLVSVGIPAYQRDAFIEQTLRSARSQTYPNLEILVSDNASTDRTAALAEKAAQEDGRVRVYRQPENKGPTHNFRFVLQEARGEFFLWLGDDDWLDPDYVERCVRRLQDEPNLAVCGGRPVYYKGESADFTGGAFDLRQSSPLTRIIGYLREVSDNGIFYGVIRRACLANAPIDNCMGWDWILFASLAYRGGIFTDQGTRVHRRLGGATTSFQRIVQVMGLPAWNGRFPHLATAVELLARFITRPEAFPGLGLPGRIFYGLAACAAILRYKTLRALRQRWKERLQAVRS